MKKAIAIMVLGLLWCNVGNAGIKEPGTDQKCFSVFERENIFERKFLPKVNKDKGVFVTYIGCNKYYDDWSWDYSFRVHGAVNSIDGAHQNAYRLCVENEMPKYNLTGCHLFSINDVIVWGKDSAFVKKVEKEANAEFEYDQRLLAEKVTKKKNGTKHSSYVFYEMPFFHAVIFTKSSPTTFKKLTFNKERKFSNFIKRVKHSSGWKNKKLFRSFSFTAEYEDNIKVKIFVEYEKDKKDFKKAEEKALYYSNMYGQMPHFLKTYNKKIYIHNDIEKKQGFGTWWVTYKKREFHINPSYCNYYAKYYSACALIMVHELAHVIQQLTGVISPSKWLTARRLDNKKYCSKYSKKNSKEDFAESMVCWVVARHKSDRIHKSYVKKINQYIPYRLKLFDEMNLNMYPM